MSWLGDAWDTVKDVGGGTANVMTGGAVGSGPLGSGGLGGLGGVAGVIPGVGGMGSMFPGLGGLAGMAGIGGTGGQQTPSGPQVGSQLPAGYGAGAWPGWPVPPTAPNGQAPQQNFQGDFSKPGQAEGYWQQNQGAYGAPGAGQQYWNQVAGRGQQASGNTNYAQSAYQQFQNQTPGTPDPYYDRAAELAARDVNRQMTARGLGDSGAALRHIGDAVGGIRAQQAKDAMDYGLQRAGLAGQLGAGADVSAARGSQDQLNWLTGLGGLALGTDAAQLNRLNAGMNAALGAQGAQRTRGQDYFGNNMLMGSALAAPIQGIYGQQMAADQALMDQQLQAYLGYPREALNQNQYGRASSEQGLANLAGILAGASGANQKAGGGVGGFSGLAALFA